MNPYAVFGLSFGLTVLISSILLLAVHLLAHRRES